MDQEDPEPPHIEENGNPSMDQEDPEPPHIKEEWSPSLDQEDPEPPHIKEEQEELWTSQEGEQLPGLEEADITKIPFTPVPVKSEDDEEKPQSSQLHQNQTEQMETEADGKDCGGPEPARNSDPGSLLQPETEDKTEESFKTVDSVDSDYWKETREHCLAEESLEPETDEDNRKYQFDLNSPHNDEVPVSHRTHVTDQKMFSCSECGKRLTLKGNLQRHMRIHTRETPFSCSVCSRRFPSFSELKKHKCVDESSNGNQTKENREAEPRATSSVEQMETEADGEDCGGPEPARNSDPDRPLQPETEDSSKLDTEDSDDDCEETRNCPSGSNTDDIPVMSGTHITDRKSFSCSVCGKIFTRKANLQCHMKIHTGEKPFSCSECGARFFLKGNLQSHIRTHTGEKPFSCSECGKRYNSKRNLQSHMRTHTGEKPFSCSECGRKFTKKGSVQRHMRIHTREKPFSCSECGKTFNAKDNLKRHTRTHTGEKPFSCSECGKTFPIKQYLTKHMRLHIGEKPFGCSVCGERFMLKFYLTSHMRSHPEEPLSCSECGKTFTLKTSLKVHMRIHTGEKPFSCRVCDRRFTWRKQLKKHKCGDESSHGNQPEENREAEPRASSSAEQMEA
ncbi:gastrula zinc finger protein XlCGF26.1-like [Micropterus dolomieu]|uniref:gastrula zinc finger protein XlCGF26.1-like n=1 Tax=Micropterus dolomieu TaxID=147949 RepID=UPI001E8D2D8F|nr:gastrula zinc finger protein XlCGF26.1-like [Micropterus dolomieu]XP_045914779.1 gastrula zinc finger protein XlCGF26.1-like [Micropterus dolomieu]XP_045914780.1 gastrula zinc finger protein XlCGF26.1-like [Micropterus dolomieu]XP_045914781.1 gastrula zinc finger protein XlCGF26.1-like [Micropterus dolomieu]